MSPTLATGAGTRPLRAVTAVCACGSLALLMLAPRLAAWLAVPLALAGLARLIAQRRLERSEREFLLLAAILPLAYLLNMAVHGWDPGLLERPSRLLIGALVVLWLSRIGLPRDALFWSVVACALSAAAVAFYYTEVQGLPRAHGRWNAVPFGNFSLLFGFVALAGALCLRGRNGARTLHVVAGLIAAAAGLYASLQSGTRGGWLAIPPLTVLLVFLALPRLTLARRLLLCLLLLAGAGAALSASPEARARLGESVREIGVVMAAPEDAAITSSIGIRLAMWRWGLERFGDHPWLGIGIANYREYRQAAVAAGQMPPDFLLLANLHNELISNLALGGLVGGTAVLAFWLLSWRFFHARLRRAGDDQERFHALFGLLATLGTAMFSMTEGLFGTSPGTVALALTLALPAGALCHLRNAAEVR